MGKIYRLQLIGLFFLLFFLAALNVEAAYMPSLPCDFFGFEDKDSVLHVGDIITAQDPDGIICGTCTVEADGRYGFLSCRADDPNTIGVDEGANDNDINRKSVV